MMELAKTVQASTSSFTFPLVVFHGLGDTVTMPSLSERLFEDAPSTDKTLVNLEGAYHALWWEAEESVTHVAHQVEAWVNERTKVFYESGGGVVCKQRILLTEAELAVAFVPPVEEEEEP